MQHPHVINKLCCHLQALRRRCVFNTQQHGSFSCDCISTVYREVGWRVFIQMAHIRLWQGALIQRWELIWNWRYFRHLHWCLLSFKASDKRSAKNLTSLQRNLHNHQTSLWHPLQQKYCPANRTKKFQKLIQLMLNNIRDQSRSNLT